MARTILYLLAGLGGGLVLAAIGSLSGDAPEFDDLASSGALSDRVAVLERALERERRERERLAAELGTLRRQIGEKAASEPAPAPPDRARQGTAPSSVADASAAPEFGRRAFAGRNSAEDRIEQLVDAGFSLDQAERIERRTEELRVEAMQYRYEAIRQGAPASAIEPLTDIEAGLRAELGDADYERYLEATGRPTRVSVRSVLASSAAEQAGMQPGDEIYSYGGERVFSARDLNRVLLEGEPGEPVLVEVLRDGRELQLVLPRGPVGVTSGRFGGRRGPLRQ